MLTTIKADHFRNFTSFSLEPSPEFNLIFGLNGSGKSSILETIYFLSLARSFRTHLTTPIISHEQPHATLFGTIENENHLKTSIGIQKTRNEAVNIHINGEPIRSNLDLARLLPVILINPDSYELLHGGPLGRRQFLNWALFHVEQIFVSTWRNFQRCLKQRNMALKTGLPINEIQLWDKEFVELSFVLDKLYVEYIEKLVDELQSILPVLTNLNGLTISYYPGWNREKSLEIQLKEGIHRERQQGFTAAGPHRADLKIYINGVLAQDILSRGEQKLFIFAMQLAQASLLKKLAGINSVYLIDDMAAELDNIHRKKIIDFFISLDAQVFLTCLEREQVLGDLPEASKVFHVERGVVGHI